MKLDTPILTALLAEKDARYHKLFTSAVETLNKGLAEQKIWNVEINDAKYSLSNGIDRALEVICARHRSNRSADYQYEPWMHDFSSYCSPNQAAGRIKRLTKNAPKTQVIADYIVALGEVAMIWHAIVALKPFIVKGRRPNENKTEAQIAAELSNTGVCAIRNRRQKLEEGRMVHHGYKMSDYNHSGYRIGKCFGVDYLCYELSNEANVAYKPVLAAQLKRYRVALKELKSGTVLTLTVKREKGNLVLEKGTREFDQELNNQIWTVESYIRYTKSDIKANDAKISGWKRQPLKYGGKQ